MYTSHTKFGIGKIIGENETTYTVYFDEIEQEKTPMKAFTKLYATIEDAENGLEMKIEAKLQKEAAEEIETEKIMAAGKIAQNKLQIINEEMSKRQMRNI